jgi:putative spermidine/putrescine transport system ATP-binding protein
MTERDPGTSDFQYSLQLIGVSKSFGRNKVLRNIDLHAVEGEFLSLLGPSGCGKTTTLNIIAGFISPDSGKVVIDNEDKTKVPSHKRKLSMVFQNYSLFPHMTVFDNISFGLKMQGFDKNSIREKVRETLNMVHLTGLENRFPRQLSGGQQQRVGLARALAVRPRVLLLDEPLSNLDAKLRKAMQLELRSIQKKVKITTIYVTHDQEEALALSDRILVMNQGLIEQEGSPQDVFSEPQTEFVAEFMGVGNFFDAVVLDSSTDFSIVEINGTIQVTIKSRRSLSRQDKIRLAVRPDRVSLKLLDKNKLASNELKGKIQSQVYVGSYIRLEVTMYEGLQMIVHMPSEKADAFQVGDYVKIDVPKEDWLVLGVSKA